VGSAAAIEIFELFAHWPRPLDFPMLDFSQAKFLPYLPLALRALV
jgi:hypothetical protein